MSEKMPVKKEDVTIETCDLSVLVARALNLTQSQAKEEMEK